MKSFYVELASDWVLEHSGDKQLPVKAITEKIVTQHPEYKITDSTFWSFVVIGDNLDMVKLNTELANIISSLYGETADKIISDIKDGQQDGLAAELGLTEEELEEIINPSGGEEEGGKAAEPAKEKAPAELEAIRALAGGEEFKALAEEVCLVAKEIKRNDTADVFTFQSYLVSINNGYGLSTFLTHFAKLIGELQLADINMDDPVDEVRLGPVRDSAEPFEDALRLVRGGYRKKIRVACIDISEWMNAVNNRFFREFLHDLAKSTGAIVFFRVPFVDKYVLDKIAYALNDVLYVRTVSFAPLTKQEVCAFAESEIKRYGFKMSRTAWENFHRRISEEKSDGRFYGLNTIKKVVRELIYKKQLTNARRGKTETIITKQDTKDLCMEPDESNLSGFEMLSRLVGCENIRARIEEMVAQIEMNAKTGRDGRPCIHMRFTGNPGTGKTTVARIVGKILKERGVLSVGNFYEYSGRDFCGRYIGETAPKTASMCRDAYGSVLFIDEAYSLYRGGDDTKDFGREALETLIAEMENHRSDFVVIMAGYTDDMERLLKGNAGLASRMPYTLEFPNFTREQLYLIYEQMIKKYKYEKDLLPAVKEYFLGLPDEVLNSKEFSNARFVRNLFERTCGKAAMRCQLERKNSVVITKDDFERSTADNEFNNLMQKKSRMGF